MSDAGRGAGPGRRHSKGRSAIITDTAPATAGSANSGPGSSPVNPPTAAGTAAGLWLGCAGLLMLGLQPLMLGQLLSEARLDVGQLAWAATLEFLCLGLAAGGLGALARHRRLRAIAALACALLAASNAASLAASGLWLIALRAAAGAAGGVLVWVAIGVITVARDPARLSAIFLGAQTAAQALLAALLPLTLLPWLGANGGFAALAGLALASLAALAALPSRLPDMAEAQAAGGRIPRPAWAGLGACFLFMGGIVGLWVFIAPLAAQAGIPAATADAAVAGALVAQVAGAAVAAMWGALLPARRALALCLCSAIGLAAVLGHPPGTAWFIAAMLGFGFVWLFALPFFVPLLIAADPSRRAALLIAGAQLLGGSAGPLVTGAVASQSNLRPVLLAACLLFALALLALAGAAPRKTG